MEKRNLFVSGKAVVAAVCGAFTAAFGWLGWLVVAWTACMALDWVSGSAAAAEECRAVGYEAVILTDQLCCEAREAGSFLASILRTHAGNGRPVAFLAGGETVVHLTGKGLGGRNQELALAAGPGLAGAGGSFY